MERIEALQGDFSRFIKSCDFAGNPTELFDPVSYTILQEGKRMRPMLCLLACDMFEGDENDALWPALALETFHNFTLIHDDIMDQAPLRRGLETVYKKWNANVAILSGDAMLAMAFQFASRTQNAVAAVQLLGKVACEVCEGQQYDLNFETKGEVTLDEYLEMIRLKTAVLLASSLQMGAMIANASEDDIRRLYDFGINLGMAFQLQDDLLDCYGDVKVFGKVTGGDIAENKKTYLFLKALEMASDADRNRLQTLFSGHADISVPDKISEVTAIYDRLHIKEAVTEKMAAYYRSAKACLDAVGVDERRKEHLRLYAERLSGREK